MSLPGGVAEAGPCHGCSFRGQHPTPEESGLPTASSAGGGGYWGARRSSCGTTGENAQRPEPGDAPSRSWPGVPGSSFPAPPPAPSPQSSSLVLDFTQFCVCYCPPVQFNSRPDVLVPSPAPDTTQHHHPGPGHHGPPAVSPSPLLSPDTLGTQGSFQKHKPDLIFISCNPPVVR